MNLLIDFLQQYQHHYQKILQNDLDQSIFAVSVDIFSVHINIFCITCGIDILGYKDVPGVISMQSD